MTVAPCPKFKYHIFKIFSPAAYPDVVPTPGVRWRLVTVKGVKMRKVVTTFVVKGRKILLLISSPKSSPTGPNPKLKSKSPIGTGDDLGLGLQTQASKLLV